MKKKRKRRQQIWVSHGGIVALTVAGFDFRTMSVYQAMRSSKERRFKPLLIVSLPLTNQHDHSCAYLLTRSLSSGGFTSGLLGACHCDDGFVSFLSMIFVTLVRDVRQRHVEFYIFFGYLPNLLPTSRVFCSLPFTKNQCDSFSTVDVVLFM